VANALDKSHKQKFSNISISYRDNSLTITGTTTQDITLEKGLFEKKADFFEEVYGIRPQLKQKRG
jgi:exopolyphosphatase/guanosine-5'-triphosphate,3'-diphosphate pyrophosphatase